MKKIFNIVFSSISDELKVRMLENIIGEDLTTLNEYWDTFSYEFQVYRSGRIKSSNIKYINYDTNSQVMTITFNNNSVYEYYKVDMMTYLKVRNGLATPKTTGKNRYGSWNPQKFPSNGAALYRFIKKTGIKYKRVK